MSLLMDSRKNGSSSTTDTNNAFGIRPPAVRSNLAIRAPPNNVVAPAFELNNCAKGGRRSNATAAVAL
jgi:hypothetical protein